MLGKKDEWEEVRYGADNKPRMESGQSQWSGGDTYAMEAVARTLPTPGTWPSEATPSSRAFYLASKETPPR